MLIDIFIFLSCAMYFFKLVDRYPLAREGVSAPGRSPGLPHARERGLLAEPAAMLRHGELNRECVHT